ncbi:MAG: carboxypeptidase-like regulatory domain-containing protein [Alphaproteobacteria bacterium]|nr:carboxypeptidase-like regulatory domain-containing protein [Alphaproteobacteria bacterium]
MLKNFFTSLLLFLFLNNACSQKFIIVSGYIKDDANGESISGCQIFINNKIVNVISNNYGFYSIKLNPQPYDIKIAGLGYINQSISINTTKDTTINFRLILARTDLQEVVIKSEKNSYINKTAVGFEKFDIKTLDKIPVIFGERDIIKSLQLLPGVKSIGEGSSGISVRGGTDAQNLYLLDEATVYNPSHFGGLFSSFNSDALKDVQLYKGYTPAQFGGRLSSALDIRMKDGDNKKFEGTGGIGLISSRLSFEGPFKKNKSSWIISGRRTYFDVFLPLGGEQYKDIKFYFYDLNVKTNFTLNAKNKLYVSGYFGKDVLALGSTFGINWGNQTLTLRLNHLFTNRFFSNTSLIYSNYDYNFGISLSDISFKIESAIKDYSFKQDMEYFINNNSKIKFGAFGIFHRINPGAFIAGANNLFPLNTTPPNYQYGLDYGIYYQHELKFGDKIGFNYGLRINKFDVIGPTKNYGFDVDGNVIDTFNYGSNELIKSFVNIEPRLALSIQLTPNSTLKFAYSRNSQNLHLLSNSNTATPADLWIMNSKKINPEYSDEISSGYFTSFLNKILEFSVEVYYKFLQNQIDFKPGTVLRGNDYIENDLLFGKGRAYGIEFLLRKKKGKFTGWIAYTLARIELKIDGINNGNYYPANQNRTHEISIVGNYEFNSKWSLASNFIFYTGNSVTYPSGKYQVENNIYYSYPSINSYNLPNYNRLDISAIKQLKTPKKWKHLKSNLSFGVYNIYGRENPFSIAFITDPNNPNVAYAEQTALYRFVPYITWNFNF